MIHATFFISFMASFEYEICTFIQLEVTGTYKEKIKNKFQQEAKNTHTQHRCSDRRFSSKCEQNLL